MSDLQFRNVEPVADWQWIAVIVICCVLFSIFIWLKQNKTLIKKTDNQLKWKKHHLGNNAVVYDLEIDNVKYCIFESKNGVAELVGKQLSETESE